MISSTDIDTDSQVILVLSNWALEENTHLILISYKARFTLAGIGNRIPDFVIFGANINTDTILISGLSCWTERWDTDPNRISYKTNSTSTYSISSFLVFFAFGNTAGAISFIVLNAHTNLILPHFKGRWTYGNTGLESYIVSLVYGADDGNTNLVLHHVWGFTLALTILIKNLVNWANHNTLIELISNVSCVAYALIYRPITIDRAGRNTSLCIVIPYISINARIRLTNSIDFNIRSYTLAYTQYSDLIRTTNGHTESLLIVLIASHTLASTIHPHLISIWTFNYASVHVRVPDMTLGTDYGLAFSKI